MTVSLSSKYDVDTISDIDPADWDRFRTDFQALISYFEHSPNFRTRPTVKDTVKSWRDSVQVPLRDFEVALCRTRGMTVIKSRFQAVEDLFVRALIITYCYHGKDSTAVFASGSESAWDMARQIAEQATSRAGIGSVKINVEESRIKKTAACDAEAFASIYDAPRPGTNPPLNLTLNTEKRWFF